MAINTGLPMEHLASNENGREVLYEDERVMFDSQGWLAYIYIYQPKYYRAYVVNL